MVTTMTMSSYNGLCRGLVALFVAALVLSPLPPRVPMFDDARNLRQYGQLHANLDALAGHAVGRGGVLHGLTVAEQQGVLRLV